MLPDFLKPFAKELKKYEREYIKIEAHPVSETMLDDPLSLHSSKFGGLPFIPQGQAYPQTELWQPMLLFAQINFAEMPALEPFPSSGLLQLFASVDNWYEEEIKIRYVPEADLQLEPIKDFSFLKEINTEEGPIFRIHELEFNKEIDFGGNVDSQFNPQFNGMDYWAFAETLNKEEQEILASIFSGFGHKIGGYAQFAQGDFRHHDESSANDLQLLQIDVDDYISFGDSGTVHLFINPEDLNQKDFEEAYFYWDCY